MVQRYPRGLRAEAKNFDERGIELLIRKPEEANYLLSCAADAYSRSGVDQLTKIEDTLKDAKVIHPEIIEDICRDFNKSAGLFSLIRNPEFSKRNYVLAFKSFFTGFIIYFDRGNMLRAEMYIHRASDAAGKAWGESAKMAVLTFMNDIDEHGEDAGFIRNMREYTRNLNDVKIPKVILDRVAQL